MTAIVGYKDPRALHEGFSPLLPSSYEEPEQKIGQC